MDYLPTLMPLFFLALLKDADTQTMVSRYRVRLVFFYETLADQKDYVYQLAKLVKAYNFLSSFYKYSEQIEKFVFFAEAIGSQLIKEGSESELMNDISKVLLSKAAVNFLGTIGFTPERIKKLSGSYIYLRGINLIVQAPNKG